MKFFTGPVAIVLEADMSGTSQFCSSHTTRVYAESSVKPDLGVPKSIVPILYLIGPYFGAQSEIRAVALFLARQLARSLTRTVNGTGQFSNSMPLDALPSDVTTVIQDFCGTRELGYSLGCCSKAWRLTDAAWKRLASRHPLTRLAVKYV